MQAQAHPRRERRPAFGETPVVEGAVVAFAAGDAAVRAEGGLDAAVAQQIRGDGGVVHQQFDAGRVAKPGRLRPVGGVPAGHQQRAGGAAPVAGAGAAVVAGQPRLEDRLALGPDRPQRLAPDDGGEPGEHAQRVDAGVQPAVAERGRRPFEVVVIRVGEEHLGRDQVAELRPPGRQGPLAPLDLRCERRVIRDLRWRPAADAGQQARGVTEGRRGRLLDQQPGFGKPPRRLLADGRVGSGRGGDDHQFGVARLAGLAQASVNRAVRAPERQRPRPVHVDARHDVRRRRGLQRPRVGLPDGAEPDQKHPRCRFR